MADTPFPLKSPSARMFSELRDELSAPRDPFFNDAAASGELLVARIRLLLLTAMLTIHVVPGWYIEMRGIGLGLNLLGLLWAILALAAVAERYRPWMGFVSSAVDVSLVSFGLVTYLVFGQPQVAVNSRVTFDLYFLTIGWAALRYDWRVCAFAGLLAACQYIAIVSYAAFSGVLAGDAPATHGTFSWGAQVARALLLGGATLLSTALVLRAQRLRRLSTTDRLTGLHNRGVFEERLVEEASRARRYERPLSVAILDIDHFKEFNDTHGHAGGDMALQTVAGVLRGSVRRSDVVARYGGEEFALLLPETTGEEAAGKLESIRQDLAAVPLTPRRGVPPARITISIGVASWPGDGDNVADIVAIADARLYEAKRAGRNRVAGPGSLELTGLLPLS